MSGIDARRGDLAILVTAHRDLHLGKGVQERTTLQVGQVVEVTRTRLARKIRPANGGAPIDIEALKRAGTYRAVYIVPADEIDVPAALRLAAERPWPGGRPGMPFDDLDEVREALRPHLRRPEVMT